MNEIRAYFKVNDFVATSGQPTEAQFLEIADAAYSLVVNLALPTSTHALANERDIVESAGMIYVHIPVSWEAPQLSDLQSFFEVMQSSAGKKVWVHCALNMRVSCFMYLYRSLVLGLPDAEAKYPMSEIWQPDGAWAALINAAKEL
jgi:protein tyrosine phosphatase (PTP) superfamily phosphohydrolase (DUF442 family)